MSLVDIFAPERLNGYSIIVKKLLRVILIDKNEEKIVYTGRNIASTVIFVVGMILWLLFGIEASIVVYRELKLYNYKEKLTKGYIPFLPFVDRNDAQYSGFINNIFVLTIVAAGYTLISVLFENLLSLDKKKVNLILSNLFIIGLYGAGAINVYVLILVNYCLVAVLWKWATLCKGATWIFWILLLYTDEKSRAYTFSNISEHISFLDKWKGHGNRWYMALGFICLKAISYNIDYVNYLYGLDKQSKKYHDAKCKCTEVSTGEDALVQTCRNRRILGGYSDKDYSFLNYLSYMCYAPLYLCGPVITFNDYVFQTKNNRRKKLPVKEILIYTLHIICLILMLEFSLHFVHVFAIYNTRSWILLKPRNIFALIIINFVDLLLKLTIIWRFFRLWAMLDKVFTIENTANAQFCTYSIRQFWKTWHRSFSKWCTRYIYVPLGGYQYSFANIWVIFSFSGLWHNFQDYVFQFGWINCVLILLEFFSSWFRNKELKSGPEYLIYVSSIVTEIPAVILAFTCWVAGISAYFIGFDQAKSLFSTYFSQNHYGTTIFAIFWVANYFLFSRTWSRTIFSTTYATSDN